MKITIRNRIKIDQNEELVKEVHQGKISQLSGKTALTYTNAGSEKVLIRFDENELLMTRFVQGNPVTLHFHKDFPTESAYEELGNLSVLTDLLELNLEKKSVRVHYQLAQNKQKIGDYKLRIDWTDTDSEGDDD